MSTRPLETTTTTPGPQPPRGSWRVDPTRSTVRFETRAMFGLLPVHGSFSGFDGTLRIDDEGRANGELRVEVETIATGIAKRDAHLRSADFFHIDAHPHMVFALDAIEGDRFTGTLTIRTTTIPVSGPVAVEDAGTALHVSAEVPIEHGAAGLGWAKAGMVRKTILAQVALVLVPEAGDAR